MGTALKRPNKKKKLNVGVLDVAQQGLQCPCSVRMQFRSWAQCSGLKELALPQLQPRSQLHLGSEPWPENFHMPQGSPKKKKNNLNVKVHAAFIIAKKWKRPKCLSLVNGKRNVDEWINIKWNIILP